MATPTTDGPRYMTLAEIANDLGIAERTLRRKLLNREPPVRFIRIGSRHLRVRRGDYEEWLHDLEADSTSAGGTHRKAGF